MTGADLHMASGAYVLHALSPDERAAFESHVAACEACREEVAELKATAARLGAALSVTPPAEMRERVMRRVAGTRQEGLLPPPLPVRRTVQVSRVVLAACLTLAAAGGGVALWQHQEAEDARASVRQIEQRQAGVAEVLTAPDVRLQTREWEDGSTGTVAYAPSKDAAALIVAGLAELPATKVYEAWFAGTEAMRSAGLIGGAEDQQLVMLDGPVAGATTVAITVEPAGGSPQPTSTPLGVIKVPTA
ncbi:MULTISPECIES: anti-sigma factor [unclassified Streptomyces]|uniref:anti-sigma factor n=1 Tax=unclassified Streptomyces TaxID=2593676 RepID=UPI003332CF14